MVLANVALVALILVVLEIPLAVTFARRERDASSASLQRDSTSLAALSEELIEHPSSHDPGALAHQFASQTSDEVVVIGRDGAVVTSTRPDLGSSLSPAERAAVDTARSGKTVTGRDGGRIYAVAPVGSGGDARGAVFVSRDDNRTESRIRAFWLALVLIAVAVLAVAALVGDRLARWATRPLRRLDESAVALGAGDLSTRVDIASGPPEAADLARTFNEMASRLEELVASHRQFVADASHQLRSPLTALRLRLESIDGDDPDHSARDIEAALAETQRLSRLVDGLLALARADVAGPQRHIVDVADVVEARREAWEALAEERGVAIEASADDRVTAMFGEGHLEQILDNLIDNAIGANQPGGHVWLHVARANGTVEVHVRDDGPGMSPDDRARAFDTFWQGRGEQRTGSTGLGLSIVDRLARANGGTARIDPRAPHGLDVVVSLPATHR
jgi:signal transduction histidine kinase